MDHCTVEYGGATNNANIYCYISNPKIYNSQIRYSSAYGIYFNSSTGRVEDSIIEDNSGIGVYLTGSSNAYILNNTIQNNSTGGIQQQQYTTSQDLGKPDNRQFRTSYKIYYPAIFIMLGAIMDQGMNPILSGSEQAR